MGIIIGNEDKRPRIVCHNCKHQNIIDIRGWNIDATQIGEITCISCRKKMYVGILIMADITVEALGGNVQAVVDFLSQANSNILRQGENEPPIRLDN